MKDKRIIAFLLLLIIFVIAFILYRWSLKAYFFQDDWFSLIISNVNSLQDFLHLFAPRRDVIYYRPLGMQIPFFISSYIFGLNSIPLHLFSFIIHAFNIYLVFLLSLRLTKKDSVSLISAFFFATSSIHFIPFFWSSTISFPLGLMFFLLTFILFLDWHKTKKPKLFFLMLTTQILSLVTNELALTFPLIAFFYMHIFSKINYRLFIIISIFPALYVILRILYLPKLTQTYTLAFGKPTLYAAASYFLWLFNWPEEIKHQLENLRAGYTTFFSSFPVQNILLLLFSLTFIFLIFRFFQNIYAQKSEKKKLAIFFLCIIISGLVFPLLFPLHIYPYYLLVSLVGLSYLLSFSIIHFKPIYLAAIIIFWILGSYITINFQNRSHWAYQRSQISRLLVNDMLSRYPTIKKSQKVHIENVSYKIVLSDQNAFKVLYNKDIQTIYYGKESNIWDNNIDKDVSLQKERFKWNYVN